MKDNETSVSRREFLETGSLLVAGVAGISSVLAASTATAAASDTPNRETESEGTEKRMKMQLSGPNPYQHLRVKDQRGQPVVGIAVNIGVGPHERTQFFNSVGLTVVTEDTWRQIDAEALTRELEVDRVAVNGGRIWTMDEVWIVSGLQRSFSGVVLGWFGEMISADLFRQLKPENAYVPSLIKRPTNWVYYAGRRVNLLREPNGTVWVQQEYTKALDPTLTMDNLDQLGSKFSKLPAGWTFESKVLDRELSLDTMRSDGWASIIRDELGCSWQACGYGHDTSANYVP
jgi:hypothetical protein